MKQFIELRHNPIFFPNRDEKKAPVRFDELIFITAEKSYKLDYQYQSAQHIETEVSRFVADNAGKTNLILNLGSLLEEGDPLKDVLLAYAEGLAAKQQKGA